MTEWLPIDSAPKDGTQILGYYNGQCAVVQYKETWNEWCLVVCGDYAENDCWTPELWMPIPAGVKLDVYVKPPENKTPYTGTRFMAGTMMNDYFLKRMEAATEAYRAFTTKPDGPVVIRKWRRYEALKRTEEK